MIFLLSVFLVEDGGKGVIVYTFFPLQVTTKQIINPTINRILYVQKE